MDGKYWVLIDKIQFFYVDNLIIHRIQHRALFKPRKIEFQHSIKSLQFPR